MKVYKTHVMPFTGSNYREVKESASSFYKELKRKSKRRPYVRSAYFGRQKIFLELFWVHVLEKNYWDQMRRMKLFACGVELIQKSHFEPSSKENPNKRGELLHRFAGITKTHEMFFVQIKEDKRTNQKWLMSVFPVERDKFE